MTIQKLIERSLNEAPQKKKYLVYLEFAKIEEYYGNINKARSILCYIKDEMKTEWKIFLEYVLFEMRQNNIQKSIQLLEESIQVINFFFNKKLFL